MSTITGSDSKEEMNLELEVLDNLDNPDYYINRELSWIKFNIRILEEAQDKQHPLLERVKFLAICGSNLDEFFMTRIARLIKKIDVSSEEKSIDGKTPIEQLETSRKEILPLIEGHSNCWSNDILPALRKERIVLSKFQNLPQKSKEQLREFFIQHIRSKIRVYEKNDCVSVGNLNVCLCVNGFKDNNFRVIEVPVNDCERLVNVFQGVWRDQLEGNNSVIFAEDLVANCLDLIFNGETAILAYPFRLTRNAEINILRDESADFLNSVKKSLSNRRVGFPTRLEFQKNTPQALKDEIAKRLGLHQYSIYEIDGPLGLVDLWQLHKLNRPRLKDKSFCPSTLHLIGEKSFFSTIAKSDSVLYHPYDDFGAVIDLLKQAARDRFVEKIFITMYRTEAESPVVDTLIEAAKNGKQVTAIIELKAKFDEENNINLVSRLKQAGIKTVYNFPTLKVHAKLCLITRWERGQLIRYSHIGSGNYNSLTAKIYADIGYLTANPEIGLELEELLNVLIEGLEEKNYKHILVAPKTLKPEILRRINREIAEQQKTGRGYLAFKLNNLEDKEIIKALYKASMAGVKIDLNVRALCCLKPGIKGISDNISVISIVGRFLEHARIYFFGNGEESELLIGSSDMMFRNLNERVEVLFNVPDAIIRRAIVENILNIHLKDNVKARRLLPNGTYQRIPQKESEVAFNSQLWLIQNRGIWHEHAANRPKNVP